MFTRAQAVLASIGMLTSGCILAAQPQPANLAVFGEASVQSIDGSQSKKAVGQRDFPLRLAEGEVFQVEWTHPRDVRAVQVEFAGQAPKPEDIGVEWWHRIWPDNGGGGWMRLDDPFNGDWARAKTEAHQAGQGVELRFAPLDTNEVAGLKRTGFVHRHTYKVRVSAPGPVSIKDVKVLSDAVEKTARLRFEWDLETKVPGRWAPRFEARNGRIMGSRPAGKKAAIVEVAYADSTNRLSADRGIVICRSGEMRSFSVFVDDVLREGGLYVRDIGAFVSDADKNLTYASWPGPGGEVWKEGTIAEQVERMPEQTFEQVMKAIPAKAPNEIFLGAPSLRQEIAVGPKGDIRLYAGSLRSAGPDAERRAWLGKSLVYEFSTGENPKVRGTKDRRAVKRSLTENWLPVVQHEWTEGEIVWKETCVAAPLLEPISRLKSRTGTETVVLVAQFTIENTSSNPRTASLWLELSQSVPMRLGAEGTIYLQRSSDGTNRPGLTPLRGRVNTRGKGTLRLVPLYPGQPGVRDAQGNEPDPTREGVHYSLTLQGNESHSIEVAVPYVEHLTPGELAALQSISYVPTEEAVVAFWKERVGRGMTYEVPEQFLNEFFKASLWHALISTDIDPVTGHHQHGAATHVYPNFVNETAMVARSLEMRGEHEEAARLLQPFIDCQGVKALPGNFKGKEGVFYAAHPTEPDPYTAQGYNMHHGWGLWAIAEHFTWTRDKAYLQGVAEKLVKGCDWVTREREATKFRRPDGSRPVEYGLAPAGDLEDVAEYLYFYATDAYYYFGMKQAAAALTQIKHPERRRLARDAEAFARDIRASVAESVATSPVVRLKDGTYVPYVPSRAYALTHLKEGWIREALYPALYLYDGEVYPETHPYVEWIVQDQEDNIFLSKESGYGVADQKANFFNFGGFTLQPNLPNLPLLYLQRDQVPNFLRGFYNTCWASLYPDTMCFAEWVPYYGRGGGPLFKTPDEAKFIQWMRYMLIMERGTELELGLGVPRRWMEDGKRVKVERAATFFGALDMEIKSQVNSGAIAARVKLTKNEKPSSIWLRLRHPEGRQIKSATVNGRPAKINTVRQLIELPARDSLWEVQAEF